MTVLGVPAHPVNHMRAITVLQPWAWAIAAGIKAVENRPRKTHIRGQIVIHAGQSLAMMEAGLEFLARLGIHPPADELIVGAAIAVANLVDSCPSPAPGRYLRDGHTIIDPFATGPECWVLEQPQRITPFPCRGQQGWWHLHLPIRLPRSSD